MAITVPVLEHMNISALDYAQADLGYASKWFGEADASFTAGAKNPVESGAVWSGDGQPDAVVVLQTNGTAMQVGSLAMEAGKNAVSGLRLAMKKAKDVVLDVIATKPPYMRIEDNGFVVVDRDKFDPHTDGAVTDAEARARDLTKRLIGALLYATAADASYASLFGALGSRLPTYTDVADPGALAHNRRQLQYAITAVDLSIDLRQHWESQRPPMLSEKDFRYLVNGPPPDLVGPLLDILDVGTALFGFIPLVRAAHFGVKGVKFLRRTLSEEEEPAPEAPPKASEPEPNGERPAEDTSPEAPAEKEAAPEVVDPHTGEKVDVDVVSRQISHGHAYEKHVVKKDEFPNITTRDELTELTKDVITNGEQKKLSGGRVAYWKDGVVVFTNPKDPDGGTVFPPTTGRKYFDELEAVE